jgi:hypothetical protein
MEDALLEFKLIVLADYHKAHSFSIHSTQED